MRAKIISITCLLGTVTATAFAAPSLSQPGQDIKGQMPAPQAQVEKAAEPAPQASEVKFKLTGVKIDASELKVDAAALEAMLAPCVGRETTLTELNAALARVTAYCRSHGYPASAAYLPAQDSKDGKITVKVIPGRYGEIKLDNHSRLKDKVARQLLRGLQPGSIIRSSKLETALYSISDVSGTRAVGVLAPGKAFGTSDVTVRIEDGKPTNTVLYAENYGAKSSGRYRYGLQHTVYDVGGTGGRLGLGTLISNSHMHNYYANYEMPVGRGGSTLGLGLSQMDYKLGGAMRNWGANGKADTVSLFGSDPFYHLHDAALKLNYGLDYRRLEDDIDKYQGYADSKKHSVSAHVGVEGSAQLPKTALSYDATLTAGHLTLGSEFSRIRDETAHTAGTYTKLSVDGTVVRSLGHSADVLVKASGQMASRNLDGSEQMYLGGANAVRAYPQGEGSGDVGLLGTAEVRLYTNVPGLVLSTYLDAGHVRLSHDGSDGSETLKGWGLAASYTRPGDWFARLDYARRIGESKYLSEDAKSKGRVWFLLGKIW
ncbi:ShlB/FhaC/HecB family hemolysin secretion/activation protein [Selenomonas bovis]|uniref:ShlB/FhaC/HecB family hemolysin secretion/activation protein n=1 Tax=Selenomonas bovis TaxID=416586 RepID=UPI0004E21562|nr:ShlB/FhaC/HecB family hemolysin secretion/activation protein [Selenomonas bovis]